MIEIRKVKTKYLGHLWMSGMVYLPNAQTVRVTRRAARIAVNTTKNVPEQRVKRPPYHLECSHAFAIIYGELVDCLFNGRITRLPLGLHGQERCEINRVTTIWTVHQVKVTYIFSSQLQRLFSSSCPSIQATPRACLPHK